MIRTTAGTVNPGSPWLQPLPVDVRGVLAQDLIRQTDGGRTLLRLKPVVTMERRERKFTYLR